MASLDLLGVPSSSAAHWPGQEKAPRALRTAGLTALLSETGHRVIDHGDFFDLPVADVPQDNSGLTFAAAMAALTVLVGHPAFAGLIITEFNPDHGEPDGSTTRTLATGIAAALGRRSTDPP